MPLKRPDPFQRLKSGASHAPDSLRATAWWWPYTAARRMRPCPAGRSDRPEKDEQVLSGLVPSPGASGLLPPRFDPGTPPAPRVHLERRSSPHRTVQSASRRCTSGSTATTRSASPARVRTDDTMSSERGGKPAAESPPPRSWALRLSRSTGRAPSATVGVNAQVACSAREARAETGSRRGWKRSQ